MGATILVIDDHASVRTLLARVLEDAGYQVYEAANGRQGLEQFRAQPVNLVITDLEMPEMNGLEVILELTRAFLDVKVIAMSGRSADELQKARLIGARQTFPKPLISPRCSTRFNMSCSTSRNGGGSRPLRRNRGSWLDGNP